MALGKELTEAFEKVTELNKAPSARRQFTDAEGNTTIPIVGDEFPGTSGLLCIRVVETQLGGDVVKKLFDCEYGPTDAPDPSEPDPSEVAFRSLSIGGDLITIDAENGFRWQSDNAVVTQPLQFRIALGQLRIRQFRDSDDWSDIYNTVGLVNETTFEGLQGERWLYIGAEIQEGRDAANTRLWTVDHNYRSRIISRAAGNGNDGWNFELREANDALPIFDKPLFGTGGTKSLYDAGDIQSVTTKNTA